MVKPPSPNRLDNLHEIVAGVSPLGGPGMKGHGCEIRMWLAPTWGDRQVLTVSLPDLESGEASVSLTRIPADVIQRATYAVMRGEEVRPGEGCHVASGQVAPEDLADLRSIIPRCFALADKPSTGTDGHTVTLEAWSPEQTHSSSAWCPRREGDWGGVIQALVEVIQVGLDEELDLDRYLSG